MVVIFVNEIVDGFLWGFPQFFEFLLLTYLNGNDKIGTN